MEKVKVIRDGFYEDRQGGERALIVDYSIQNSEGETIGGIQVALVNKPIRCLILESININKKHRNKGYAKFIMQKLQELLKDKNLPAVVINGIHHSPENAREAFEMYERYGWQPLFVEKKSNWKYFSSKPLSDDEIKKLQEVSNPLF
jgi:GNAT superfamily N-acetyltransferase